MTEQKLCWLSLGSNLPHDGMQPAEVLEAAIIALKGAGFDALKSSDFYQTEPVPKSDQPDFVNCVVTGKTDHTAHEVLDICQSVEKSFGRDRTTRWGARTLDIDIIDYGHRVYPSADMWHTVADNARAETRMPELVLPHPFMHKRAFVLQPLCDLAPDWQHPVYQRTAVDLLSEQSADDRAGVVPI